MQASDESSTSVVAIVVGIYMIVQAIALFCLYSVVVGCGGVLGGLSSIAGRTGEASAATALGATGFLVTALGILGIALAVGALAVAIGLFLTKPWAYMGAIVVNAIFIGLQLIGAVVGMDLNAWQIVLILLSGAAIFFLLYDQGARRAFGRA